LIDNKKFFKNFSWQKSGFFLHKISLMPGSPAILPQLQGEEKLNALKDLTTLIRRSSLPLTKKHLRELIAEARRNIGNQWLMVNDY